ncbi:hypothetical protein J2S53_002035 [Actinopolyspora lacussalsi]|nr:hypothetical protein [Actinopolyspora lacussalsi]
MDYVEQLKRFVSPSNVHLPDVDWVGIESSLGSSLPGDYKRFIEVYGPGDFDSYILVVSPCEAEYSDGISEFWKEKRESFIELRDVILLPSWVSLPEDTLLPWAGTPDGDAYFWQIDRQLSPDDWDVVLCDGELNKWYKYKGGMVRLLLSVFSGESDLDFFSGLPPVGQSCFTSIYG